MTADWRHRLLWIDGTAGAVVGIAVVALNTWLADWYGLPRSVLLFTGVANLAYASYSLTLARRSRRTAGQIRFLVAANLAWAPVCFALAATFADTSGPLGLAHLVGEGLFVGGLGIVEWHARHLLITDPT